MLLRSIFYLRGIPDIQQTVLDVQPRTVHVSAYNEQLTPLSIHLKQLSGSSSSPLSGYIRIKVMSGELELGMQDFGYVSEAIYTLPSDKWGHATHVVIEAHEDAQRNTEIARDKLDIIADNPMPFPVPEAWDPNRRYKNGEYLLCGRMVYMWRNRLMGNTLTAPDNVANTDPFFGSWQRYDKWDVLLTQMFVAEFGLVGASVFSGDYTISQHGVAKIPGATYQDFTPDMTKFEPNIVVDWLRGKIRGLDLEILGNSVFRGILEAKAVYLQTSDGYVDGVCDGYMLINPGVCRLPALDAGKCREFKVIIPSATRALMPISFEAAEPNCLCSIGITYLGRKEAWRIDSANDCHFSLVGVGPNRLCSGTTWFIIPENDLAEKAIQTATAYVPKSNV